MEIEDRLLTAALARWAGAEREEIRSHPTAAQMQAYLEGVSPSAEQSELQEHISVCTSCAQELLQLEAFLSSEFTEAEMREASAVWPGVRSRLIGIGVLPRIAETPPPIGRLSHAGSWFPVPVSWALGGLSLALLVTTLYFGVQLRGYRNPRVNTVVADLIPVTASPALRGSTDPQHIVLSGQTDRVLLVLNVSSPSSYSSYGLEIRQGREANGRLLWATKAYGRTRSGNFNVDLDSRFLSEGQYSIRVLGLSPDHRELLGEYYLYIQHER